MDLGLWGLPFQRTPLPNQHAVDYSLMYNPEHAKTISLGNVLSVKMVGFEFLPLQEAS